MNATSDATMTIEEITTPEESAQTVKRCEQCGLTLGVTSKRRYCNIACKQQSYRERKLNQVTDNP